MSFQTTLSTLLYMIVSCVNKFSGWWASPRWWDWPRIAYWYLYLTILQEVHLSVFIYTNIIFPFHLMCIFSCSYIFINYYDCIHQFWILMHFWIHCSRCNELIYFFYSLLLSPSIAERVSLAPKWIRLDPKFDKIWDFFRSDFSTFWLGDYIILFMRKESI